MKLAISDEADKGAGEIVENCEDKNIEKDCVAEEKGERCVEEKFEICEGCVHARECACGNFLAGSFTTVFFAEHAGRF